MKGLYEAHESELLKDRQEPNVEGMDEEQAKEALKKDYEERRNIMDASPIHVAIAGRMMFKRVMGKASFCNIQDLQGNIQVYVARDAIGTESYADFKNRISVISSEWKDLLSEQEQVRFLSMQRK